MENFNTKKESVLSYYLPHQTNEMIPGNYGIYKDFFVGTDYQIGVSSKKDGALARGRTISCYSGVSEIISERATKAGRDNLPPIKGYINGLEVNKENITKSTTKSSSDNTIRGAFGKNTIFSIGGPATKSDTTACESVELYIPEELRITFPPVRTMEDVAPLWYYKDFTVKWNADPNNSNGVIVYVEWFGDMLLGEDLKDTYVRRVAIVPDTGSAVLSNRMFEGIPDTAYCNLTLLRGNVKNVDVDSYSYKLMGESHQSMSFILIRNIKKK